MSRDADDEVLMFVSIAHMCRRFNCLPGPGGLLEQDGYIMMGVAIAMDAIHEKEKREQKDEANQLANKARG